MLYDEKLAQSLKDVGCEQELIDKFFNEQSQGQIRLLRQQRFEQLDKVHKEQKKLDCLDFIIYKLKKDNENKD